MTQHPHAQSSTDSVTGTSQNITEPLPKLAWSVRQAAKTSALSERSLWAAIAKGELGSVKVAGRRLVPDSCLRQFLGLERRG